jgi:EAL domain-containing protein (putative c-di-GMP-specific phosphodiesterase class I)
MVCAQVEDQETLEALRVINVAYAQGFGIERPQALA